MKKIEEQILDEISDFLSLTKMSERAFGLDVANNNKFVRRLRDGKGINSKTINSVRRYIADHKEELRKRVTIETCNEK